MFVWLVLACSPTEITATCAREAGAVEEEDTELDLGFSVAELVADSSERSFELVDLAAGIHAVTLTVSRTADEATLVDATVEEEVTKAGDEGTLITADFDGACVDELTVPVVVELADDAGAIDIAAEGTLWTDDDGERGTGVLLDAQFDPLDSVLPPGFHPGPVSGRVLGTLLTGVGPGVVVWVVAEDGAHEAVLATEESP